MSCRHSVLACGQVQKKMAPKRDIGVKIISPGLTVPCLKEVEEGGYLNYPSSVCISIRKGRSSSSSHMGYLDLPFDLVYFGWKLIIKHTSQAKPSSRWGTRRAMRAHFFYTTLPSVPVSVVAVFTLSTINSHLP